MAELRWESGEQALLLELAKDAEIFIDIGANCGVFTLAARQAGLKVVAVEPNAENLKALLFNLQRNNWTDVEVLPIALAEGIGVLPLFGGRQGASLTRGWGGVASNYSRLVPVNCIDNLFSDRFSGKRLLIKIDVEGNEYDVITGASRVMKLTPAPVWILEHGFDENFGGTINPHFRELFELFWTKGYRCFTADDARQPVLESDVNRWVANRKRDFGYINYFFCR